MRLSAFKSLGLVLGTLGVASAAHAADLPLRTAPPVFTAAPLNLDDWSGIYVGTTYGYGFNHFKNTSNFGGSRTLNADGQAGGALIGYNMQFGHVVVGAEGSIDENVIRGTNPTNGVLFPGAKDDSLYDIRFRGILGYEFGHFMPFIAGGAVLNEGYMSGDNNGTPDYLGANRKTVGWTVGGGLEYKLYPQELFPGLPTWLFGPVTLRGEYLYQNLPSTTYRYGGLVYRTKSDGSFIRGALIYRFGDNPPRPYVDAIGDVNWGGGYGGIIGGYGTPNIKGKVNGISQTIGASGGLGGIYAGTNFMFGHTMLGIDGSTAFSDFNGSRVTGAVGIADPVHYRGYIQSDIRARAGYAFGSFLPFVAAGYSFERGEIRDSGGNLQIQRGRVPLDAFTVGGGLDYRLSERVSLRIEDVYDLSSTKKTYNLNGNTVSFTRDGNTVRGGFAYHFE